MQYDPEKGPAHVRLLQLHPEIVFQQRRVGDGVECVRADLIGELVGGEAIVVDNRHLRAGPTGEPLVRGALELFFSGISKNLFLAPKIAAKASFCTIFCRPPNFVRKPFPGPESPNSANTSFDNFQKIENWKKPAL